MPITKEQQRFLQSRLETVRSDKPEFYEYDDLPDTAPVKFARVQIEKCQKILDTHRKKSREVMRERKAAVNKEYNRCGQIIRFGNPDAAIKAIDEFEAKKF